MKMEQEPERKYDCRIVGASATGRLHVINAMPCQDAFSYEVLPSGIGVIAIADGLGSAILSEFGARNAVDTLVSTVSRIIPNRFNHEMHLEDIAKEAFMSAREVLEKKSTELKCKLKDLACTLIGVVIHRDTVAVVHIGDGAVIARTDNGLRIISGPGESEYANEVSPLTGKDWEKSLRVTPTISGISVIMAFTDGLQRAALKKRPDGLIPFEGFCDPLFSYAKEMEDVKEAEHDIKDLLSSKKVCDNSEDDKTLVIAALNVANSKGTTSINE